MIDGWMDLLIMLAAVMVSRIWTQEEGLLPV